MVSFDPYTKILHHEIKRIYHTLDILQNRENARAFQEIPKEWDYGLNDGRAYGEFKANTEDAELDLVKYYLISKTLFQARIFLGMNVSTWMNKREHKNIYFLDF